MKIALICPSNMLYMPYVKNYEQILIENNVNYHIINWDRLKIEEQNENTYRDKNIGGQKSFLEYLGYRNFLVKRLNIGEYDKLIVFGIQLSFFLKNILINNYKGKYIIDIRDYNKILHFFKIKEVIKYSSFTVLSSPGYKVWLPKSNKYFINHNTLISTQEKLREIDDFNKEKISIANIGAFRDFSINRNFISSLKNSNRFLLKFHGEGHATKALRAYLVEKDIENVIITGKYNKTEESSLYEDSDFINALYYPDWINYKTALPNRLYNAVFHAKPLLAFQGTYLANLVSTYNIGIVILSFDNIEQIITDYIKQFDLQKYNNGRDAFFKIVLEENLIFKNQFIKFCANYDS